MINKAEFSVGILTSQKFLRAVILLSTETLQ